MAQPYVGEIRMFAGNFAPAGWMFCEGQLLPISENETLFQLIGTTYGGDGEDTFGLPDMRGRLPLHQGNGFTLAETGGVEEVTLTTSQIPVHKHLLSASTATGFLASPQDAHFAAHRDHKVFVNPATTGAAAATLNPTQSPAATGGSQPHSNMPPYLCVSFIISLFGIFPSPT